MELAREVTGEAEPCAFERQFRDAANEAWTNALPLRPADLPAPLPPTPHASARRSSLVQPAVAEGGA